MGLVRVAPLPGAVVSKEDAKRHLRVDHADEDSYIEGLVAVATAWAEGWLGRALKPQVWDWRPEGGFGSHLELPLRPVLAVQSVKYRDPAGAEQTWAETSYTVEGIGDAQGPGVIVLNAGVRWPLLHVGPEPVTIRFEAGYPDAGEPPKSTIPEPIIHGILLTTARLYENRENPPDDLSLAAKALMARYRVYS